MALVHPERVSDRRERRDIEHLTRAHAAHPYYDEWYREGFALDVFGGALVVWALAEAGSRLAWRDHANGDAGR